MLEKFNQIAQHAATSASRRQFLGRVGRGAMAVAAAMAGLVALPDAAQAVPPACGPTSQRACVGKLPGAPCNVASSVGYCAGPPNCTCRTCPRGSFWQPCNSGQRICCRRGYYCYVINGVPTCRRGA
jgi:hypothetical protein